MGRNGFEWKTPRELLWAVIAALAIAVVVLWPSQYPYAGDARQGIASRLKEWQPLIAAVVAIFAAYVAYTNTQKSLAQNQELERRRRGQKHAALRATLPLALAAISDYAERSAQALDDLLPQCVSRSLPKGAAPQALAQPLPSDALKTLSDFIEYSDEVDVGLLEITVAWVQIHDSRVRGLVNANRVTSGSTLVPQVSIEGSIIDAASIYAGASKVYDYARRRSNNIPNTVSWDDVFAALRNIGIWDIDRPEIYKVVEGRSKHSLGPFDALTTS